ncbi:restriction endonuclease subunit S [Bacteroides neonati]|uniref:restriction endonuclease subunit S n=1 Tax=Bacteroides neonati TaxID=1347393 RepID=UPI001651D62E|nr:restriction endonuclease subunit S [Bacteroides neonati]
MKQRWEIKKLGEVCKISPPKSEVRESSLNEKDMVSFIPMEDLGINEMYITPKKGKSLLDVVSGYTYFANNDLLLAKVTPCFENGKLGIAKNLYNEIGFGSSEYIVIRANDNSVKPEYVYYGLSSDIFRRQGAKLMLGASGLKRLPKDYVANYELRIPSIPEQERIVWILDSAFAKIEALRANAQQNLQNTKDLFQASLKQELTPKQKGKYKLAKDLFDIKTGKLNANAAEENGAYPFFTCSREVYAINQFAFDCEAVLLAGNNASGDFNVKHYKGKFNAYQRTYVITTKSNQTHCRILYYVLENYLSELKSMSVGANTKFLKLGMIENVQMPDFTLIEQQQVVEKLDTLIERCRAMEENYRQTITHCNALKQALLKKAFNGEL